MGTEKVFATKAYAAKTISGGVLTLDTWGICYKVSGEGGVADELVTINTGQEGQVIIIKADGEVITLKHGTGNISLGLAADCVLANGKSILLVYDGTNWIDLYSPYVGKHASTHQDGGADEISVAGLSGLLADDQHVLDDEVTAVAIAKTTMDANTVLTATIDDTPVATAMAEQTVLGRLTGGNIAALTVAQLQALLFSAALPEDISIKFDEALSADGKWCGFTTANFLAGAALAFGQLVYLSDTDSRWELAKADAEATANRLLGVCVLAADADGSATNVLILGKVRADTAFPDLLIGKPAYISAATAGAVVTTAPSGTAGFIVRIIGYGLTANELWFNPSKDYLEVA